MSDTNFTNGVTLTDADWFNDEDRLHYTIFGDPATAAAARTTFLTYSGTYTPTLTNTTNVAASTAYVCQYMRVGSVVTVSGRVDIDPTATGQIIMGMSLPIASDFSAATECGGACIPIASTAAYGIYGDLTNNRASIEGLAVSTANLTHTFSFTYLIV